MAALGIALPGLAPIARSRGTPFHEGPPANWMTIISTRKSPVVGLTQPSLLQNKLLGDVADGSPFRLPGTSTPRQLNPKLLPYRRGAMHGATELMHRSKSHPIRSPRRRGRAASAAV